MDTSVTSSPYFNVFLASQVKANDKGFLSNGHTVQTLLEGHLACSPRLSAELPEEERSGA